ncbi:MAG: hypothetical protein PUJ52_12440 [Firmicutes bacterium]|nr:hypothetical protein [Bacillota bacterium]
MRRFVNPGNTAFEVAVNSQIYVDKTGLLAYTNSVINTGQILLIGINYDKKQKSIAVRSSFTVSGEINENNN